MEEKREGRQYRGEEIIVCMNGKSGILSPSVFKSSTLVLHLGEKEMKLWASASFSS